MVAWCFTSTVTFSILGEKTTVMSPEVFIRAGVPCCRYCSLLSSALSLAKFLLLVMLFNLDCCFIVFNEKQFFTLNWLKFSSNYITLLEISP